VDECKPLVEGTITVDGYTAATFGADQQTAFKSAIAGRGLHSSTSQLNLSRF
jgi:hypothetical protein